MPQKRLAGDSAPLPRLLLSGRLHGWQEEEVEVRSQRVSFHSSGAARERTKTRKTVLESGLLHAAREFFNFFLALQKICAYIRTCRCVPKPRERNLPAKRSAAGNFRLG